MTLKIALESNYSYKFSTILDQVTYQIKLDWIEKEDAWYLDLYDRYGDPLILGHKLLYGNLILSKYHANADVPQGEFLLVKGELGTLLRPTLESVSSGDTLYYITAFELE